MKKKIPAFQTVLAVCFLAIMLLVSARPQTVEAKSKESDFSKHAYLSGINTNDYQHLYFQRASRVCNYLEKTADGCMRVTVDKDASGEEEVIIEYYDSSLRLISEKKLAKELKFGGFYAGSDAYYIVYYANNDEESNDTEVFRFVKYDKNWSKLGSASLYGANTQHPVDFGTVRMTEYGGYLYVHSCHTMYKKPEDGLNHQANVMIQVDEASMQIVSADTRVGGGSYVSHSFNQFVLVDDAANLVALDHGDAYPRSVVLSKYRSRAGEPALSTRGDQYDLFPISGETGDNFTGVSVGGFEYSPTHYLAAITSVDQSDPKSSSRRSNVYVLAVDRNSLVSTTVTKITNYTSDKEIDACTPQLVKIDANNFLLLWNEVNTKKISAYEPEGDPKKVPNLKYTFLDGAGNQVSQVFSCDYAYLSDCKPIVMNEKAVWYTSILDKYPTFYSIDRSGSLKVETPYSLSFKSISIEQSQPNRKNWEDVHYSYNYTGKAIKPVVTVKDGEQKLQEGIDYTVSYKNNKKVGTASIIVKGKNLYTGSKTLKFKILPKKVPTHLDYFSAFNASKRKIYCYWDTEKYATGYQIQYGIQNSDNMKTITIKKKSVDEYQIKNLKKGKVYTVRIRAYSIISGKKYYSDWSTDIVHITE